MIFHFFVASAKIFVSKSLSGIVKICPENATDVEKILCGDEEVTVGFVLRFLAFLYGHKFSSSFERREVMSLVIDTERSELLDILRKRAS